MLTKAALGQKMGGFMFCLTFTDKGCLPLKYHNNYFLDFLSFMKSTLDAEENSELGSLPYYLLPICLALCKLPHNDNN